MSASGNQEDKNKPWHPSCNGQVERFNRTLVSMIKAYLKGQQREWDKHLGCLAAAYRATPHESTGFTPNMLMFGREARLPIEVILGIRGYLHRGGSSILWRLCEFPQREDASSS